MERISEGITRKNTWGEIYIEHEAVAGGVLLKLTTRTGDDPPTNTIFLDRAALAALFEYAQAVEGGPAAAAQRKTIGG